MIISVGAVNTESNARIYRPTKPLAASKMSQYLSEFLRSAIGQEGMIEKETYNYIYITDGGFKFFIQASKDISYTESLSSLRYIAENSQPDIYDILFTVDNMLYCSELFRMDLNAAKNMDSQEEKIYNMMVENKQMEIKQREKEHKRVVYNEQVGIPAARVSDVKPKKIEKSEKSILIIIKEKIKITMDKDNYLQENGLSGEINMIIAEDRYRGIQLKMQNLKGPLKFSPYLDKNALKKSIIKFEKERGINKSIPLMKWSGKIGDVPLVLDVWIDEEDGKYLLILGFKAKANIINLEFKFKKDDITEVEVSDSAIIESSSIRWPVGNVKKGEGKTCEIRYFGFDSKSLFPVSASFTSDNVDSLIDVDEVLLDGSPIDDYEVRKITEVETFNILNE